MNREDTMPYTFTKQTLLPTCQLIVTICLPALNQTFRLLGTPPTSTMGNVPYKRPAEMYPIKAEAQVRLGNTAVTMANLGMPNWLQAGEWLIADYRILFSKKSGVCG